MDIPGKVHLHRNLLMSWAGPREASGSSPSEHHRCCLLPPMKESPDLEELSETHDTPYLSVGQLGLTKDEVACVMQWIKVDGEISVRYLWHVDILSQHHLSETVVSFKQFDASNMPLCTPKYLSWGFDK